LRKDSPYFSGARRGADRGGRGVQLLARCPFTRARKTCRKIQGFAYAGEGLPMLFCIRVHRAELCERSSPPGRRRRTARWKFEAVVRIVRLLDTIKAPGSPGHLSRPSDEGKVVEPTVCQGTETNRH
jgi:hypothetical protein